MHNMSEILESMTDEYMEQRELIAELTKALSSILSVMDRSCLCSEDYVCRRCSAIKQAVEQLERS